MNNSIRARLRGMDIEAARKNNEAAQVQLKQGNLRLDVKIADLLVIENLIENFLRDFMSQSVGVSEAIKHIEAARRDLESVRQRQSDTDEQLIFDEEAAPDTELSED